MTSFAKRLVFEPTSKFPSSHAATVAVLPDGDLFCAWYSGSREGAPDTAIYGARFVSAEGRWTEPEVVADRPGRPMGNPVLFLDLRGRLWLFFVVMHGEGWHTCSIWFKRSADGGRSWGTEQPLREEPGWMVRTKPVVLRRGGAYLLPAYDETVWAPAFFLSEDEGRTWEPIEGPRLPCEAIQPAVVELSDGSLLAYLRTRCGRIWAIKSEDGGRTWEDLGPTPLPNPNSAVELIRLRGGRLLLLFNESERERTPLVAALSSDEGRSWPQRRALEGGEGEFSYPSAVQAPDGSIHAVYTWRRLSIAHVTFDEGWLESSHGELAEQGLGA